MGYVVHQSVLSNGTVAGGLGLTPTAVRELAERQSVLLRLVLHELRTPLTTLNGALSMILDGSFGPAPEPASRALLTMAGSVETITALLDGLVAVARQDDGVDALRCRRCHLRGVVAEAVAATAQKARDRQINIEQDGPDVAADVDPELLRIAVANLVANAIAHSPAGSTAAVAVRPEKTAVTITVSDDGSGVAPADADRLFEAWQRGAADSNGLGLGLWLVRWIAQWHGGWVTLDSVPGHGATFGIVLPWDRGATEEATA